MPYYFVGEVDVKDPEGYKEYSVTAAPIISKYGGKVLAKGGKNFSLEGSQPAGRVVIVEFPDESAAKAFWACPEYQAIVPIRRRTATARAFLVEGVN